MTLFFLVGGVYFFMKYKDFNKYMLLVLGVILVVEGLDTIFSFDFGYYLFILFWLVACFVLGAGVSRYYISD